MDNCNYPGLLSARVLVQSLVTILASMLGVLVDVDLWNVLAGSSF